MNKLNKNFADKYKINDVQQIKQDVMQWQSDVLNEDDSAVRLTDFVISMYKTEKDKGRNQQDPYVVKIQGYQVILLRRERVSPLSIYSPLAKQLLGHCDPFNQYIHDPSPLIHTYLASTHYAIEGVGLDPLDDEMTRRLMTAGKSLDYTFARLCYEQRDNVNADNHMRWLCHRMSVADPVLAMVKLINSFDTTERKRILDVYDTYGATNTIVGDALIHLDKFRSF